MRYGVEPRGRVQGERNAGGEREVEQNRSGQRGRPRSDTPVWRRAWQVGAMMPRALGSWSPFVE